MIPTVKENENSLQELFERKKINESQLAEFVLYNLQSALADFNALRNYLGNLLISVFTIVGAALLTVGINAAINPTPILLIVLIALFIGSFFLLIIALKISEKKNNVAKQKLKDEEKKQIKFIVDMLDQKLDNKRKVKP